MSLNKLIQKIEKSGKSRSHEKRMQLLRDAHILDSDGNFDKRFFSTTPAQGKVTNRTVKS